MKKQIFLLFFLCIFSYLWAADTTFTELRGMEDENDDTHLFYRKHIYVSAGNYRNDIFHLDISNRIDTLFLPDFYQTVTPNLSYGGIISDYQFPDSTLAICFYCGASIGEVDWTAFIARNDVGNVFTHLGVVENIEISSQNDSLIFADFNGQILVSRDEGFTWEVDEKVTEYGHLIALSPIDDRVFYITNDYPDYNLYKTFNSGQSFSLVDSTVHWNYQDTQFFFDSDSLHLFATTSIPQQSYLLKSENSGNSWMVLLSDSNEIHCSLNSGKPGYLYVSVGKKIMWSYDYGESFSDSLLLDMPIVGIYKKPNSDILFAATKKQIFEINSTGIYMLKSLPTGIHDKKTAVLNHFKLFQNYPNPFNPETTIEFYLPKGSRVRLEVFNLMGQKIRTLIKNQERFAGPHRIKWNGLDDDKNAVASGIYIYRLQVGNFTASRKMLLLQ